MKNLTSICRYVYLCVIVIVALTFAFFTFQLIINYLLPRFGLGGDKIQDFLGIYSLSVDQIEGWWQFLLGLLAIIILCLCELIPWLIMWYIIYVFCILGLALIYKSLLNEREYLEVFGAPDKWKKLYPTNVFMKMIMSRTYPKT